MIVLSILGCSTQKKITEQERAALETAVTTPIFQIKAAWAYPLDTTSAQILGSLRPAGGVVQGNSVLLDSGQYTVEVKNDSVFVNLPYFGTRQISGGLPGNTGIYIKQPLDNWKVLSNKNNSAKNLRVTAAQNGESYDIAIRLFATGTANIVVNSTQRQSIRYTGYWK